MIGFAPGSDPTEYECVCISRQSPHLAQLRLSSSTPTAGMAASVHRMSGRVADSNGEVTSFSGAVRPSKKR